MGYNVALNNTAEPLDFLLVLSSDHITGATGKTPTVLIAKSLGAFAAPAGAVSEVGFGWYRIAPNASDANTLGPLKLHATATGTDPRDDEFLVVDYNPTIASITTLAPTGTGAESAQMIINRAFDDVGVKSQGEALGAADVQDAFVRLNNMIGQWATQTLTIPFISRTIFALTANVSTYTIGPGGDFDVSRPQDLTGAGLLLAGPDPRVEIPRAVITDDMYEDIRIKDLANSLFTAVYYNNTYASGLGTIVLWPVPDTNIHDLVLYRREQLGRFATLTALYDFPPGYSEALEYNLARRLLTPYTISDQAVIQGVVASARESLASIKRANVSMTDMENDAIRIQGDRRYGYNINTGY
jgi:hypothetical protein